LQSHKWFEHGFESVIDINMKVGSGFGHILEPKLHQCDSLAVAVVSLIFQTFPLWHLEIEHQEFKSVQNQSNLVKMILTN